VHVRNRLENLSRTVFQVLQREPVGLKGLAGFAGSLAREPESPGFFDRVQMGLKTSVPK
jgi:hypothetical protein